MKYVQQQALKNDLDGGKHRRCFGDGIFYGSAGVLLTMHLSTVRLSPRHLYQLELILLFAAGFFLFFPYYNLMRLYEVDMQRWQWYFFFPWMGFFTAYSLVARNKIKTADRIPPLRRSIAHWVLLSLALVALHAQPTSMKELYSIDVAFTIFTIFLADAYWDFKKK